MNTIMNWFNRYDTEITWFIIGWMMLAGCHALEYGDGLAALIDFGLVALNYFLYRGRR